MKKTTMLRHLLEGPQILMAPGAYDGLSARLIEQAGFKAAYMTGAGVTASLLGQPDVGLLTMTEMVEQAARIASAIDIPVICDADTGYGNAINVMRTVRQFESAGVAAIHLEDQVTPKRCGHFEGKQVIPKAEMAGKIEAAVEARRDPDFVIIARTDARAVNGLEDAMARGRAYAKAGADIIFLEAPQSKEELRQVARAFDVPSMANMPEGGKTPLVSARELEEMGFRLVIFPGSLYRAAVPVMQEVLRTIAAEGTTKPFLERMLSFEGRSQLLGLPAIQALEEKFLHRE